MKDDKKLDRGSAGTILAVDDDPQILKLLQSILEDQGYKVAIASDGNNALEILEKNKNINLVITDIIMPGKEGVGLIRSIRRNYKKIKIIAMSSATNFETILDTAMGFGADATFKKPFSISELIEKVDSLLG